MKRFWSKVNREPNGCWNWESSLSKLGYGSFWFNGASVKAHRLSYELSIGPIPDGLDILHSCDNRRCVNPAHLRPGTHAENMREKAVRGRVVRITKPRKDSASGMLGVCKDQRSGRWVAYFTVDRKRRYRAFGSFEDAVAQRRAWEQQYLSRRPEVEGNEK